MFFLIIIVYLPTTIRERAKASVEDPPGVLGPLADASESIGLVCHWIVSESGITHVQYYASEFAWELMPAGVMTVIQHYQLFFLII